MRSESPNTKEVRKLQIIIGDPVVLLSTPEPPHKETHKIIAVPIAPHVEKIHTEKRQHQYGFCQRTNIMAPHRHIRVAIIKWPKKSLILL